jgi:hypothetical protein
VSASRPLPTATPQLSVLVTVQERHQALDDLYREVSSAFDHAGIDAEFVFAVTPENRRSADLLTPLIANGAAVRALVMTHAVDHSTLLRAAAHEARAETILILPAYPRIRADALPALVAKLATHGDMVVAERSPRRDMWINRLQQRVFHALLPKLAARIVDLGCGVLVTRKGVFERIPIFGDLVRFLPLFTAGEGFAVAVAAAPQDPRDLGTRIYGPGVYVRRVLDLIQVFFLLRFLERPLRFFGLIGSVLGVSGAAILLVLFLQKMQGVGIANRPLLLLGLLFLVVGIQIVAIGLVAEIIVFLHASARRGYRLAPDRTEEPTR